MVRGIIPLAFRGKTKRFKGKIKKTRQGKKEFIDLTNRYNKSDL